MVREFCSKCNSLTNMMVSESERTETDSEGKDIKVITNSFHCDSCHTFVRSEEIIEKEK